eukprot:scaffold33383_cov51-Phaeocystis_antarctica.AAC.3
MRRRAGAADRRAPLGCTGPLGAAGRRPPRPPLGHASAPVTPCQGTVATEMPTANFGVLKADGVRGAVWAAGCTQT